MQMKRKSFLAVITFIVTAMVAFYCCASFDEQKVRDFLNSTGEHFIETLELEDLDQKYEVLDGFFDDNVDTMYVGEFVLGRYYRLLDETQKEDYQALFKRYLKSLYKSYSLDFETDDLDFEILSVEEKGRFIDALCRINLPERYRTENFETVSVVFKLKEKEGKYFFVDLKIGEASMLLTLRNRFSEMMKQAEEEPTWFLEDFQDLVHSNEQNLSL